MTDSTTQPQPADTKQSPSRIATFDLMRGYFLVVILVDHLIRHPSIFDPFTGRGLLWVSAAEGFFFVSGLLIGLIRRRSFEKNGFWSTAKIIWARAAKLYAASVILTLLFTLVGYLLYYQFGLREDTTFGLKYGLVRFENPWDLITNTLTFNYVYGWADFLVFYSVFLLLSPFVLLLLRWKLGWLLAAALGAFWLFKFQLVSYFYFPYAIWATYFFLGTVFGYHYHGLHERWLDLKPRLRRGVRYVVVAAAAVTLAASFVFTFGPSGYYDARPAVEGALRSIGILDPANYLFDRIHDLKNTGRYDQLLHGGRGGLLRLPLFLLWFGALFVFVRRFEQQILDKIGWLLVPLGQNSLYVYIIQSAVVYAVPLLGIPLNFLFNTLVNIAALMLVWFAVKKRFLFRIIPR